MMMPLKKTPERIQGKISEEPHYTLEEALESAQGKVAESICGERTEHCDYCLNQAHHFRSIALRKGKNFICYHPIQSFVSYHCLPPYI